MTENGENSQHRLRLWPLPGVCPTRTISEEWQCVRGGCGRHFRTGTPNLRRRGPFAATIVNSSDHSVTINTHNKLGGRSPAFSQMQPSLHTDTQPRDPSCTAQRTCRTSLGCALSSSPSSCLMKSYSSQNSPGGRAVARKRCLGWGSCGRWSPAPVAVWLALPPASFPPCLPPSEGCRGEQSAKPVLYTE